MHKLKKHLNIKQIKIVVIVLIFAFIIAVGTTFKVTFAWLCDSLNPLTNIFSVGSVTNEVNEQFTGTEKTDVKIKNTGNVESYIRVALVPAWVDTTSSETTITELDANDTYEMDLNLNDWFKASDGYYYYKYKIAAEGSTNNLINTCTVKTELSSEYVGKNFELQVISSSIQAKPVNAVQEAWPKVMVDDDGNLIARGNNI